MKVHKYEIICYESILNFTHSSSQTQTRLFIPNQGILGYRDKNKMDFFTDNPKDIAKAQEIILGKKTKGIKYLGEIDLPGEEVLQVVVAGKSFNQAKKDFERSSRSLVDKV